MKITPAGEMQLHLGEPGDTERSIVHDLISYAGHPDLRETAVRLGQIIVEESPQSPLAGHLRPDTPEAIRDVVREAERSHAERIGSPTDDPTELLLHTFKAGGVDATFGRNNIPLLIAGAAKDLADWRLDQTQPLGGVDVALSNVHIEQPATDSFTATEPIGRVFGAVADRLISSGERFDSMEEASEAFEGEAARQGVDIPKAEAAYAAALRLENDQLLLDAALGALRYATRGELSE